MWIFNVYRTSFRSSESGHLSTVLNSLFCCENEQFDKLNLFRTNSKMKFPHIPKFEFQIAEIKFRQFQFFGNCIHFRISSSSAAEPFSVSHCAHYLSESIHFWKCYVLICKLCLELFASWISSYHHIRYLELLYRWKVCISNWT